MSDGIYSTAKLLQHPEALVRMARGERQPAPLMIDFMPQLACNQSCRFCAYGHRLPGDPPERDAWKNMELMSDASMPREKMQECVASWASMGVKAIELTGGGEPLIYPHVREFLRLMAATRIELAVVTNGTALREDLADAINECAWRWARVSIDAGTVEDYTRTRRVPEAHWRHAWAAVELLASRAQGEQRVGVGFVVDETNFRGVYEAARLAREHGADNIRVTLAFSPRGLQLFPAGVLEEARDQAARAAADFGRGVQVHNLIDERSGNLRSARQDYAFCGMKEVRCVVGGDQNVYTCCSLAFSKRGLIGSIAFRSFRQLWESPETRAFLAGHDARRICTVECLYEQRNKAILGMLAGVSAPHGNFV